MIDQEVMSRVAAYRGNPAPLQQRYAASQNLIDLLALQKIKSEKEAAARQMQLQMSQQQAASGEMPPTVAQQREQEVMDLTKRELAQQRGDTMKQQQAQKMQQFNKLMGGIAGAPGAQTAAQPKAMAAGGIVAFNGGGATAQVGKLTAEQLAKLYEADPKLAREAAMRARMMPVFEKIAAAAQAVRAGLQPSGVLNPEVGGAISKGASAIAEGAPKVAKGAAKLLGKSVAPLAAADTATTAYDLYNTPTEDIRKLYGREGEEPSFLGDIAVRGRAALGMLNPFGDTTEQLRKIAQERQRGVAPEAAPPVSAVYPDETKRGTAAGLAAIAPPAPDDKRTLSNVEVTAKRLPPTPPAAPAPAGIPAALPQGPAAPAMPGYLDKAMQADVERDPFKQQKDEEARITGLLAASPEEKAAMAKAIAQRQEFFDQQYNPERMRREGLISFLTGAGGRRYGEFGAGAQAARAYEEAQYAQRGKDFEAMEKSRLQPFERQREAVKGGIEGGLKGLEAASGQRRTAMQSGVSAYGTDMDRYRTDISSRDKALDREIEKLKVQAQQAATTVQRESLDFSRMQGHLNKVNSDRARVITAIDKLYASQFAMIDMGLQANPKDAKLLEQRKLLEAKRDAKVDAETKQFDDAAALIEARLYGKEGAGGYTVRDVTKPTK